MVKVIVMLKRKPGMGLQEFHRYWKDVHGPLVLGVPELMRHVRRYVQSHSIDASLSDTPADRAPTTVSRNCGPTTSRK